MFDFYNEIIKRYFFVHLKRKKQIGYESDELIIINEVRNEL